MLIKITPNNNRLRQLCRDHGTTWRVIGERFHMPCFNGALGVMVESMDGTHQRNVPMSVATLVEE